MAEGIAPLIMEIRAKASEVYTELGKVRSEFQKTAAQTEADAKKTSDAVAKTGTSAKKAADDTEQGTARGGAAFKALAGAGKALAIGIGGVAVTVGGAALKMGMDFQESMTSLVTGAGESEKNIGMVGQGILAMAGKVGLSSDQLAKGMYLIESAGFHGAAGLKVLQAAAEGARVGNADMKTVADGVTTALSDYGLKASDAARVTSELVKTVASGKTNMGDLAASLATVLPVASTAKIGLDQVLGAMATMTAKGTPAADAATYLKQTIAQLSNPTTKAAGEMKSLGLSAIDISQNLGKRGLTGTMDVLTQAIAQHMGPQGTVLIDTLKKGASSAGGLQSAISKLPPAQQTYVAALADMVGGTKSMQAALMLTGASAGTFKANVKGIGEATTEAGGHVEGFAETQKDLKTKLENAKAGAEAMVTALGMKLIPVVTAVIGKMSSFANMLMKHPALFYTLAGIIGGVVVVAVLAYAASMAMAAAATIAATWPILAIIAAVIAVGVAIYELVTHWTQVWGAIKSVASAVWDWMKGLWDWISGIFVAGFETAIHGLESAWNTVWGGIKTAAGAVWDWLKGVWNWIANTFLAPFRAGVQLLGTIWGGVWDGIKAVINVAWGVIKQVGGWIMNNVIDPIKRTVQDLGTIWGKIWGGIADVAKRIAGAVSAALGGIVSTIQTVIGWVSKAIGWFESLWNNADRSTSASQRAINMAARVPAAASINTSSSLIGGNLSAFVQHHDVGGWITGARGTPQLSVDHGGEYMLSLDMLAGRQPVDPRVRAAIAGPSSSERALTGGGLSPAAGAPQVTVIAQTNASAARIAAEVGWKLRAMA